jgi:hypothetical protein
VGPAMAPLPIVICFYKLLREKGKKRGKEERGIEKGEGKNWEDGKDTSKGLPEKTNGNWGGFNRGRGGRASWGRRIGEGAINQGENVTMEKCGRGNGRENMEGKMGKGRKSAKRKREGEREGEGEKGKGKVKWRGKRKRGGEGEGREELERKCSCH